MNKTTWYYYYCSYGPGHQSHDEGFIEYSNSYSKEDIGEHLSSKFESYDWPIVKFWKIKCPPKKYVDDKIKSAKKDIKFLREKIKRYSSLKNTEIEYSEKGDDEEISEKLFEVVNQSLLEQLHKRGIMITSREINSWKRYKKTRLETECMKPNPKIRKKVLEAIRHSEKYKGSKK